MLLTDWLNRLLQSRALADRTEESYRLAVRAFEKWLRRPATVQDLSEGINEFLRARVARGSPYTSKSIRGALSAILGAAVLAGVVPHPQRIRQVKVPDLLPRAMTHEELRTILRYADAMQIAAVHLAYDTGARRGDVFWSCSWSNLRGEVLHIVQRKSGKRIVRRLRPTTIAACFLVRDHASDRMIPYRFGWSKWAKDFRKLCLRAGVSLRKSGLQMVRRSAASYTKRAGGNPSEFLGHASTSGDLAKRFYLDQTICDEPPPLPPPIDP